MITMEDSYTAIIFAIQEIDCSLNSDIIETKFLKPDNEDSMCKVKVIVTLREKPSYILTSKTDAIPKPVNCVEFYINVPFGYPVVKPHVYFRHDSFLAHVNTFRNGDQCTDEWGPYCSLLTLIEKTVKAIIYDPVVALPNAPANSNLVEWQAAKTRSREFPLFPPEHIYARYKKLRALPSNMVRGKRPLPNR